MAAADTRQTPNISSEQNLPLNTVCRCTQQNIPTFFVRVHPALLYTHMCKLVEGVNLAGGCSSNCGFLRQQVWIFSPRFLHHVIDFAAMMALSLKRKQEKKRHFKTGSHPCRTIRSLASCLNLLPRSFSSVSIYLFLPSSFLALASLTQPQSVYKADALDL